VDPIGDFLTQIRNGLSARMKEVRAVHSKLKFELCRVLLEEGFISNFRVEGEGKEKRLIVTLKYLEDGSSVIRGLELVSKQSCRVYVGLADVPRVLGGLGTAIITTPKGILTDREARRRHVGGEVVCRVW
jgi:small subunit ribosomal protein S8